MKKYFLILSVFFSKGIFAQSQDLIQNVEGRKTMNLNGDWHVIIDPYESGYYNYRLEPDESGYFQNTKPKNKS